MAFFQNLKNLTQLPGQLLKTRQAQQQAATLQSRLAQLQTPQQQLAKGRQAFQVPQIAQPPITSPVAPPVAQPTTPTPAPIPQQNPILPQLEALRKQVENIQSGLQTIQPPTPIAPPVVPPTPVASPDEDRLKKIEEEVIAGQKITPEEETTEKQLANLLTSRELGLQAVSEKPIALPFIAGQQAAITRRAAIQAQPLQAQLALLQGKRQAALDVSKTKFGFEEAREKRRLEEMKGVEQQRQEAESVRRFETQQGLTERKFAEDIRQFGLRRESPTEIELARLEIARQNAETAKSRAETTQERANIQNQINEIKLQQLIAGGGLTEEQKKGLTKVQGAEDIANQIEGALTELKPEAFGLTARATGAGRGLFAKLGLDPAVRAYQALRQSSIAPLARAISGEVGVLTDRDIARAEQLLPTIGETKEEVQRKLNNLRKAIENRRSAVVSPLGFQQKTPTAQSSNDPLGIK